jgi:GT2 family glycosyltransferase
MDDLQFGICILSHRTAREAANLALELDVRFQPSAIAVIENGGCVEDEQLLRNAFVERPGIWVQTCSNQGYAHGNNVGLRLLQEKGCRYAFVFNPDVWIPPTTDLVSWVARAAALNAAVSGPQILTVDQRVTEPLPEMTPWNSVMPAWLIPKHGNDSSRTNVHATTGCALLLDLKVVLNLGGFDEHLFLYREEQALGHKLAQNGMAWMYLPEWTVEHRHQRKVGSYRTWWRHRTWEHSSTVYVFTKYQRRSWIGIASYTVMFAVKTVLYALLLPFFVRR